MRYKKVKVGAVLLLGLGSTQLQAQSSSLYVKTKDGTQTAYTVSGIRKLTFPTGNVVVTKTNGSSQSYALSNVRYLSFADYKTDVPLVETQDEGGLQLYPNPASNQLTVNFRVAKSGNASISIVDFQGRTISQQTVASLAGDNKTIVSLANIPVGLYLCSVNNGTNIETSKLIINK
jgi:hypothetical protein